MKTGARIVLTALFTGAGIFFAAASAGGFALYWQTKSALLNLNEIVHHRGRDVGMTLASMAGEVARDKGFVSLSATFQDVVRQSRSQGQEFQIDEILIVDGDGKLRAHNDVARLAKGAQTAEYLKAEYKQVLSTNRRDPVVERSLPMPVDPSRPQDAYLMKLFPGLANERLHVGVGVFPVDSDFATAGVHLFVTIKTVPRIFDALVRSAVWVLAAACGISFFVTILVVIALYFVAVRPGSKAAAAPVAGRLPQGIEFLEAERRPAGATMASAPQTQRGVVLDAIPLDPRRDH